jgi:type II restriction enzyme
VDLHLDPSMGLDYKSPAQLAKALTENWVSREAYCLSCGESSLAHTPENTKALDFRCDSCREPYELKASKRPFGHRVLDGEYETFRHAIASLNNPNLLLLNYDLALMSVRDFRAIPRYALSRLSVIPRTPLGPTARRAGWRGCSIDLEGLPPAALVPIVVDGNPRPIRAVMSDWRQLEFIEKSTASGREWLPDILSCLRRIGSAEFALREVYRFTPELKALHQRNQNIEPKIRQQLQILVAQGILERIRPGRYKKTERF